MADKNSRIESKKAYYQLIANRIRYVMEKLDIKQTDLLAIAANKGFSLKQSTLSKMLSSDCANMALTNIVDIANSLDLNLNELLSYDDTIKITIPEKRTLNTLNESLLIYRADSIQMRAYINSFYTYFFPTKSSDHRILKGNLRFYPSSDNSKCLAQFSFKTGKYDENNLPIEKKYDGELILSPTMSVAYCILKNEKIGEISFLLFKYIPIIYEKLICRVALVLTSSAGDHRMPTVHRMIFTEKELDDTSIRLLQGQLYLNESEILISDMGLEKFMSDPLLDESFRNYFSRSNSDTKFAGLSPVAYYRFDESVIRESFLEPKVKMDAINLIRQYSASPKYNKIGNKSDEIIYNFLTQLQEGNTPVE